MEAAPTLNTLLWIIVSGLAMASLAVVGALTLVLSPATQKRILLPLVALSAGSLLGGAFFHMLPEAVERLGNRQSVYLWLAAGFVLFLVLEKFVRWHHCHRLPCDHVRPVTVLVLLADGLHNLLGGLAVGGAFVVDVKLGIATWLIAAAHEIPQELGDFGVLVNGGWSPRRALLFNFASALTFPLGGLIAYAASSHIEVGYLLPFAAGNFIYIAAADLIPELHRKEEEGYGVLNFASFVAGMLLLLVVRIVVHG